MNAKKIMGAVLVALLAAALFVGAGAADNVDIGAVTTYTEISGVSFPGTASVAGFDGGQTYFAADGTPVSTTKVGSEIYFAVDGDALNKQYSGYGVTFTLVAPTAVVAALDGGVNIIGQTITQPIANSVTFVYTFGTYNPQLVGTAGASTTDFIFIDEDGVKYDVVPTFSAGKWGVAAVLTGKTGLSSVSAPIYGQVYYFTVAKTEATLSAAVDTVNVGQKVVLNIQYPGQTQATVFFDPAYVTPVDDQVGVTHAQATDDFVTVDLGMDGTASVAFDADVKGKAKFTLDLASGTDPKVTVTIEKGTITAVADEESFFTGNAIALSGTTTAGSDLFFYIEGQNFPLVQLNSYDSGFINLFATNGELEVDNGEWTAAFVSSGVFENGKKLVAGTYTIIVSTYDLEVEGLKDDMSKKESVMDEVYGTAAVTLTQPFLTDIKADAVAIQETEFKITGTAYAADNVRIYIFGYNYFAATENVAVDEDDETFEYTLKGSVTKEMAPGVYFYLIQHPMGDKLFNVWNGNATSDVAALNPTNDPKVNYADFYYAATATPKVNNATFIFNAYERGTNYAAQALLEEIAGQNIDDTFVQGTFEVAAQKLTINPIPAEVAQGTALTVSGTSNSGEGTEVLVNVLEGQFGATIKGDENAATFLTEKAVTKADGTWEAAIDTSKLKTGTYTVTVELGGTMYDSANVEIIEAAAPEQPEQPENPEQPEQPEQPTEPETPGFGALAALAGLGAVAVLLLRRE